MKARFMFLVSRRVGTFGLFILIASSFVIPNQVRAEATPGACPGSLVSYWRGDGNTNDSVGPNHGDFVGATGYATGKVNQAFSYQEGYFISDSVNLPTGSSPRTLEFWVNAPNMAIPNSFLAGWGNNSNYQMSAIFLGWSNVPSRQFAFWGFSADVISQTTLSDNEWHHLAMTYDGTMVNLYHNGVLEANPYRPHVISLNTAVGADFIMAYNAHLEQYSGQDVKFHGLIDEVAVFNQALSGSELYQHYLNGFYGNPYCTQTLTVAIDIKPGDSPNCFNNNGQGVIPVAILGSGSFDATQVDAGTVALNGQAVKATGKSNKLLAHFEDVNNDGILDLVVQIEDTDGIYQPGDSIAKLTGQSFSGQNIEGTDTICIVP